MNSTKYMQTDGRWAELGFPKKPWFIRNCGCGEVAICNMLIEMEQYINYTPATIQPYCKQFAASNGDGYIWAGVPKTMKHYGMTDVKELVTVPPLWDEMAKGDRVCFLIMGSRNGGSKGVHWTSTGHCICAVAYKYEGGKHWLYVKDSYSNSSLRNGWISFEENMKGDVLAIWVGKLNSTVADAITYVPKGELKVDGIGGKDTVIAMQKFFGTVQDGVVSGQNRKLSVYYPALTAVEYGEGGSAVIRALQAWCGVEQDGILGKGTCAAWQYKLRAMGYLAADEKIDGIFGVKSMSAWQKFLNDSLTTSTSTPIVVKGTYSGAYPALPITETVSKASLLAELANKYAYDSNTSKANYPKGAPKPAYKTALYEAYPSLKGGTSAAAKGASCDVFVGTCVRMAGIDKNYPRGFCPDYTGKCGKFTKVSKKNVQNGDIIFINTSKQKHVCIYYGGKIKEASNGDFYPKTTETAETRLNNATVIYRAKGSVTRMRDYLKKGDSGTEVTKLQAYLDWFFDGMFFRACGAADGIFGANTEEWVKKMQAKLFGESEADGLVGPKTIEAMKKVVK